MDKNKVGLEDLVGRNKLTELVLKIKKKALMVPNKREFKENPKTTRKGKSLGDNGYVTTHFMTNSVRHFIIYSVICMKWGHHM